MIKSVALAAVLAVAMTIASHAETLSVHGSTTVSSAVLTPKKAQIEQSSGVTLEIVGNGSGRGLADLAAGKTKLAMISAPLAEVAGAIKSKGEALDDSKMQAHPIGDARVAFVVHPSNPVKSLTAQQLTDILSGKVKSWKDVGGADKPIVVIVETKGGGLRTMVEHELLNKGDVAANKREVPNATQIAKIVGQLDGALGIVGHATVTSEVVEVKSDKLIAQPLILVTNGAPSPEIAKVIAAAKAAAGG